MLNGLSMNASAEWSLTISPDIKIVLMSVWYCWAFSITFTPHQLRFSPIWLSDTSREYLLSRIAQQASYPLSKVVTSNPKSSSIVLTSIRGCSRSSTTRAVLGTEFVISSANVLSPDLVWSPTAYITKVLVRNQDSSLNVFTKKPSMLRGSFALRFLRSYRFGRLPLILLPSWVSSQIHCRAPLL